MIPLRFENVKYEDVPQQIQELFEKIKESQRGIYIYGKVGTGKTHIAYALKKQYDMPESGRYAMFQNTTELLHEMRLDFDKSIGEKQMLEKDLMDCKNLIILDDVGSEKLSDWVAETFYLIINKRYNQMLPTIITSNLPISDLKERIGDRTVSRIVEMCDIVEIVGEDKRFNATSKIKINL